MNCSIIVYIFYLVGSYLIGSISNAIIWTRFFYGVDVRDYGSANAGATNVYRVLKNELKDKNAAKFALVVGALDIIKSFVPVNFFGFFFSSHLSGDTLAILKIACGIAAIVGHVYPIYFGFRGG